MAITSLFGPTPAQIEEARAIRQQEALAAEARPFGIFAPLYQASRGLQQTGINTLVSGLFPEAVDPAVREAQAVEAIKMKYQGQDFTNPTILRRIANELGPIAPNAAIQLAETAKKLEPKEDKVTKIGVSSDGRAVYRSGLNEFTLQNGVPTPFRGSLRAEQSVSVNVGQAQKKEIIKNKADLAAKLETEATNADTQLTNATAIANVIDKSFTGFGADAVLKVGQIADAFGVTVSGTTESEQLQQLLSKLAQGQAKTLPGSLSEKELMFLREAIGTRGVTKETLRSVARRIQQDSYTTLIGNNNLQKYISAGKDLNNFDFAKNTREARRLANLLEKASPEQRKQILGY